MESFTSYLLVLAWLASLTGLAALLGAYMGQVLEGKRTFAAPVLRPLEAFLCRTGGIREDEEMRWPDYAGSAVWFTLAGLAVVFVLQVIQQYLPLNPEHLGPVRWDTALNAAISFSTNTNWQSYSGESTMSYLTQMLGLTVQNFVSAAVGIACGVAMCRGFARRESDTIGNFWVDMVRSIVYVLLPLSLILAMVLASQGVVQTFRPYARVQTLEGAQQTIALGPAASQVAIKQLGSNGGGFFNANSAHPFENPNGLTNLLELFSILLVPAALVFAFGRLVKNRRQAWALFWTMLILFLLGLGVALWAERTASPALAQLGVAAGTNMQGKETRFGIASSVLWGQSTTVTSNGSVNSMHDSQMPLSGLVYMFNIGIGEVIFGGVGVGLMGMLFYVIMTMFIAGLMIGRTPEFLGKKLGPFEMVMAAIGVLLPPVVLLATAALAFLTRDGLAGPANPGAHGLSEILYACCSAAGNNGSAFAGLSANTPFYNLCLGGLMLIGRFATIVPGLAIAGALARKKTVPASVSTFPTTGILFVVMLVCVVIIVGALTFFPFFAIGPVLEHLQLFGVR
jgi:K+-transporting ATPase ATPase A chain